MKLFVAGLVASVLGVVQSLAVATDLSEFSTALTTEIGGLQTFLVAAAKAGIGLVVIGIAAMLVFKWLKRPAAKA